MNLFRTALLVSFLACFSNASATSLVQLSLSELSFTTESGYNVKVKRDFDGRITSLKLSRKGIAISVPSNAYKDITGADIHEIKLQEDPFTQYIRLQIPANTYGENGSAKTREVYSLVFRNLKYDAFESNVKSAPVNPKDCSQ